MGRGLEGPLLPLIRPLCNRDFSRQWPSVLTTCSPSGCTRPFGTLSLCHYPIMMYVKLTNSSVLAGNLALFGHHFQPPILPLLPRLTLFVISQLMSNILSSAVELILLNWRKLQR